MYLLRAWLSPANAAIRLASVRLPLNSINSSCLSFRLCAGVISAIVCPENCAHTPEPEKFGRLFAKKVLRRGTSCVIL